MSNTCNAAIAIQNAERERLADLVADALTVYPEPTRQEVAGIAYIRAAELDPDTPHAQAVKQIRNRVEYELKKDRPRGQEPEAGMEVEDRGAEIEAADVREFLETLDPDDRTIVTMLMAGHTRTAAAQAVGISRGTIATRLKRLQARLRRGVK
jgi:RNA polymerase sigma factor (sigma-70 family)